MSPLCLDLFTLQLALHRPAAEVRLLIPLADISLRSFLLFFDARLCRVGPCEVGLMFPSQECHGTLVTGPIFDIWGFV